MNKNPLFKAPPAFGSRFRNLDAPSLGGLLAPIALLLIISLSLCHAASCTLTWNASSGPDVAGYNLRYGTTSGNPGQPIDVGNTTTRTVSNLSDATTYFFTVTAYNSSRVESQPSNEISYTTPAPTPTPTQGGGSATSTIGE
ncbi:MAG: fibronectin type III domain-containing protein, partial [Terrimicrobiaceae bacterium]